MPGPDRGSTLSLLFDLFVTNQQVRQLLGAAMADAGMTPDEYAVYSALSEYGSLSPTELGRTVGMPPTTVSHYVRTLRERGHVEARPNPADHRSFRLTLSASGLAAQRRGSRAFDEGYQRFLARLEDPERAKAALDDLRRAAGEAHRDLLSDAREAAG
ncbi:MAG TPA: MarR family transcriptional regulator [Candidatus Limnocylindria bacterium]|jgi:DNA-binding MarR family transcriptional regulator